MVLYNTSRNGETDGASAAFVGVRHAPAGGIENLVLGRKGHADAVVPNTHHNRVLGGTSADLDGEWLVAAKLDCVLEKVSKQYRQLARFPRYFGELADLDLCLDAIQGCGEVVDDGLENPSQ